MITINLTKSLQERGSDKIYGKISNYFYNLLKDANSKFETYEIIQPYEDQHLGGKRITVGMGAKLKARPNQSMYDEYVRETGDSGKVIPSYNHFIRMLNQFQVQILPGKVRPDAGGDMNNNGQMRIFLPKWDPGDTPFSQETINDVFMNNFSETVLEKYFNSSTGLKKIKDGFDAGRFADYARIVIQHEIAHYANAVRSAKKPYDDRKAWRSSGGPKGKGEQFQTSTKYYARSTEEWQARLTELFGALEQIGDLKLPSEFRQDYTKWLQGEDQDEQIKNKYLNFFEPAIKQFGTKPLSMITHLMRDEPELFVRKGEQFMGSDYYKGKLDQKTINRVKTRLYSAYEDYKNNFDQRMLDALRIIGF